MDEAGKTVDRVAMYEGLVERAMRVKTATDDIGRGKFVLRDSNVRGFNKQAAIARLARGVDLGSKPDWSDFGQTLVTRNIPPASILSLFTTELGVAVDLNADSGKLIGWVSEVIVEAYDQLATYDQTRKVEWVSASVGDLLDQIKQIEAKLPKDSGEYRLGIYFTAGAKEEGPVIHCVQMPRYLKDENRIPMFVQDVFGVTPPHAIGKNTEAGPTLTDNVFGALLKSLAGRRISLKNNINKIV
ncbi:hypothetical protein KC660_03550 [Candidatus Dojkabacteria bacterium]|uniref:Uncharacterized protein n=1 Tax=Candidatus Dojkabacteria bacterium TaxID=2099670 RepID=A0A955RIJ9_9BACT|nr:hypothetical protein [Candidatus Dojkabacteria bacterium]